MLFSPKTSLDLLILLSIPLFIIGSILIIKYKPLQILQRIISILDSLITKFNLNKHTTPFKKINYKITDHITQQSINCSHFFVGVDSTKKPVFLTKEQLNTHIQLIGDTNTGKTESIIKPLLFQNLLMGNNSVLIDGKGDPKLCAQFHSLCEQDPSLLKQYKLFSTLPIEINNQILDPTKSSLTFNPLMEFTDPIVLKDTLI